MKKQGNKILKSKRHRSGLCSRILCGVLCGWMILFSLVGCDSYATPDDLSLLKNELEDALDQLESLKKEQTSAQEEMNLLKESNLASAEEIEALKNSNTAAEQEIGALKDKNATAQTELHSLKETNQTLQEALDSLMGNQDAALQEIEKLKEELESLQNGSGETVEKIKIYIDQGHNPTSYHNSGAVGNGLYEEDLTFTIGKLLKQLLEKDGRFEVCLSRPTASTVLGTDGDSSLDARVDGATAFGADYFISLHTNSFETESPTGIEVYVVEDDSVSYDFGYALLQGLLSATGLENRGMKYNSNLRVLKNATMPAALLEMGFISNPQDAATLSQHPDWFATGIYNGILSYFELEPITPPAAQE